MKKTIKITIFTLLLFISICFVLFFLLLSPYEVWDPNVIDYDVVDVLIFVWSILFLLNSICIFCTKSSKIHFISFIVLALISLGRLISLLLKYII